MKKYIKILSTLFLLFIITVTNAQDNKDSKQSCSTCDNKVKFAPEKGDFTAQMLFGRGAFINSNLYVPSTYAGENVDGTAPYVNDISSNHNDISNMIGAEFRYYFTNKFALKFSGGAILRNTPYVVNIPGVFDADGNPLIPAYSSVDATEDAEAQFSLGAEFLLKTKNDRLFPYVGVALPLDYARKSVFVPTQIDSYGNVTLVDTGARHAEILALGVQAIAGVDYYVAKDVFFGFEIKPVSYIYALSVKSPAPELRNLEAENSTVSFFAQFSFKLGFKF